MNQQPLQKTADTPETAQQLYEEGLVLMKHKHYADALSCFEQAVELDAVHAEAWFRIGCCRSGLTRIQIENTEESLYVGEEFELYEGAIEAYQKAIELRPNHAKARTSLGMLFYDLGVKGFEYGLCDVVDYRQVIEWLKQATEVCPDLIEAYYQLGLTYTCLMEDCGNGTIYEIDDVGIRDIMCLDGIVGIADARIETYQKLTENKPNDDRAFYELGKACTHRIAPYIVICEDYGGGTSDEIQVVLEKAIKAYRAAIGIKPDYADAYNELATVYHRLGKFEEAIQAFKQAIVLDNKGRNNLAGAYHELGKQYFAGGNYMQAIECYNNAIVTAFRDDRNEVYYDLAVANDEAGHYELAIWCYRRVRSAYNYPSDLFRLYPDLLYRLGTACHKCSHYQDAVEAYQKAINRQIEIEDEFLRKSSDNLHYAEPLEYPEWWTEVNQNLESASRHEPL